LQETFPEVILDICGEYAIQGINIALFSKKMQSETGRLTGNLYNRRYHLGVV